MLWRWLHSAQLTNMLKYRHVEPVGTSVLKKGILYSEYCWSTVQYCLASWGIYHTYKYIQVLLHVSAKQFNSSLTVQELYSEDSTVQYTVQLCGSSDTDDFKEAEWQHTAKVWCVHVVSVVGTSQRCLWNIQEVQHSNGSHSFLGCSECVAIVMGYLSFNILKTRRTFCLTGHQQHGRAPLTMWQQLNLNHMSTSQGIDFPSARNKDVS